MTFLSPLLLLAAVVVSVPVLLHLLRRRQDSPIPFPALRYLRQTSREQARIIRLRQLLLLAVRILLVLLTVLAAARLILPLAGGDHPPAGLVLVIDNGLRSGTVVGGDRRLDRLLDAAREALGSTGPRDRIWVIRAGEPWLPSLPSDRERALLEIDAVTPTHVRSDLASTVRRARALLASFDAMPGEILVLTADPTPPTERPSGPGNGPTPGDDTRVHVLDSGWELPPNRAIHSVQFGNGASPREGEASEVRITVEGDGVADNVVRLILDGRLAGVARTDSTGLALIALPALPAAWVQGRVELDPDALRADDIRYFAFSIVPPPRIRLQGASSPFLREAISVLTDAGRVEVLSGGGQSDVGFLPFGGGESRIPPVLLAIPPSDAAGIPALNEALASLGAGWRMDPSAVRTERRIERVEPGVPLPAALTVHRTFPLRQPENPDGSRILVALSDGTPWLVEVPMEEGGRILLLASPMEPEATELPLSAGMVPFVDALVAPVGARLGLRDIPAGAPVPVADGVDRILFPDGTAWVPGGTPFLLETGAAGIYRQLNAEEEVLEVTAVNVAPGAPTAVPSEGTEREEVVRWIDPGATLVPSERWASSVLSARRGREIWIQLLGAIFLLLLLESWLSSMGNPTHPPLSRHEPGFE